MTDSTPMNGVHRGLMLGLIAIGLGSAALALLGPFGSELVNYRVTETLRNQTIGLDAVSLLIVAPLAVLAAVLVRRSHVAGPAIALGVGPYTSYMLLQYILGPDYASLPGNNERLFPLHLVLFGAGWLVALAAWTTIEDSAPAASRRRDRLIGRVVLPALAFVTFSRYLPALADAIGPSPEPAYLAGPSFFWAIAMLDLGVLLPAVVITCLGLVRGRRWAHKALYTVAGWLGLVGVAVAAMAITMSVNDDPTASAAGTVLMTVLGAAFAALAVAVYRPLFRVSETPRPAGRHPRAPRRRQAAAPPR